MATATQRNAAPPSSPAPSTPPAPLTTVDKLRGLPWSVATNAFNTFFVQFTFFGSVFVLFLDRLGLDKAQIGLLLSPIHFAGILALVIAPYAARFGYKRTFVAFFALRKIPAALLILTPWVVAWLGNSAIIWFVALCVSLFAILRAIEETAYYPWLQEFVPNAMRGRYTAISSISTTAVAFVSVLLASYVIGHTSGNTGFLILIGVGVTLGLVSAWTASHIPGGAPVKVAAGQSELRKMGATLRDRNFTRYLAGAGCFVLATVSLGSFLPLFMREEVGLSASSVIMVQAGLTVGSLLSSFVWGWAADRYGSKPVLVIALFVSFFLPLFWWSIPRQGAAVLPLALLISFVRGISDIGWGIGAGRLFYGNVVPPEQKGAYTSVHFAWIGLIAGLSQLFGGRLLTLTQNLDGSFLGVALDPYSPLFTLSMVFSLASLLVMVRMRADNSVGVLEFAGFFFRGNPFAAAASLVRYNLFTGTERGAVAAAERMGASQSALTIDELIESLDDPRFSVRFEAIISIARMRPHPRLTAALIELLNGSEVATSTLAAWALGRTGDANAVAALVAALDAPYRSIQVHSARSIGLLKAESAADLLQARLANEQDPGLQMAYAGALGNLQAREAVDPLLALLDHFGNQHARRELALDLARLLNNEAGFMQLHRQSRIEPDTALAGAVAALKRAWVQHQKQRKPGPAASAAEEVAALSARFDEVVQIFAANDLQRGIGLLSTVLYTFAEPKNTAAQPEDNEEQIVACKILAHCCAAMNQYGDARLEYVLLGLCAAQGLV